MSTIQEQEQLELPENRMYPIIVGLCGKACTGKDAVANTFIPSSTVVPRPDLFPEDDGFRFVLDKKAFAAPIKEVVNIKRSAEDSLDRSMFLLLPLMLELFDNNPYFYYDDFYSFTEHLTRIAQERISTKEKPRSFMQEFGDALRQIKPDVFISNLVSRVYQTKDKLQLKHNYKFNTITFVTDVRFRNEIDYINNQPNGVVIKFEGSEYVRQERARARDGIPLTKTQLNHVSELEMDNHPKESFAEVIDTDELSVSDQAYATLDIIKDKFFFNNND